MKVIYTNAPGREPGVCYRYPSPFFGPIAAATQVIVEGDHPRIVEAYRRIGINVKAEDAAPGATPGILIGSDNYKSTYEIGGETVQLGDLVEAAFDDSGLTVQEWNELAEADRDARIDAVLERARADAAGGEDSDDDPEQGDAGDTDGGAEPPVTESGDTDERDDLAAEYEARFGKKPHPAMKVETLREKLGEADA